MLHAVRTYGRMMRLSLAPSAMADIAAGILLGTLGHWPGGDRSAWLWMLASLCIVHGAMILNDWSDRGGDSLTRPDRPIPSGAVAPETALRLGGLLLLLGPVLAGFLAPPLAPVAGVLSLLALGYDLGLRGPWLGPLLLGLCRAGNLSLGLLAGARLADRNPAVPGAEELLAAASGPDARAFLPAVAYFGYVFFVSRLGRLEDGEDQGPLGDRPRAYLGGAALCLGLAPLTLLPRFGFSLGMGAALLLSAGGAFSLLREALSGEAWDRGRVGRNMGRALRRLLIFSSAAALASLERSFDQPTGAWDGLWVSLAILGGYPISFALRRVFPPS